MPGGAVIGVDLDRLPVGVDGAAEGVPSPRVVPALDVVALSGREPVDVLERALRVDVRFLVPAEIAQHDAELGERHREARIELDRPLEVGDGLFLAKPLVEPNPLRILAIGLDGSGRDVAQVAVEPALGGASPKSTSMRRVISSTSGKIFDSPVASAFSEKRTFPVSAS